MRLLFSIIFCVEALNLIHTFVGCIDYSYLHIQRLVFEHNSYVFTLSEKDIFSRSHIQSHIYHYSFYGVYDIKGHSWLDFIWCLLTSTYIAIPYKTYVTYRVWHGL